MIVLQIFALFVMILALKCGVVQLYQMVTKPSYETFKELVFSVCTLLFCALFVGLFQLNQTGIL